MRKDRWFYTIALAAALLWEWVWPGFAHALPPTQSTITPAPSSIRTGLTSPAAARRFLDVAYDLRYSPGLTAVKAEQAIVLLKAASLLDADAEVYPLLLDLTCRYSGQDHTDEVPEWLLRCTRPSADLDAVRAAVRYCLEHLDTAQRKEQFLATLLERIGGKDAILDSEIMTLHGLVASERGDRQTSLTLLSRAYEVNKYNRLAFAKLAEITPDQIGPAAYLEHLRLAMHVSPFDLEAAATLGQYAEQLELYDLSAGVYGYSADLYKALHPGQTLPPEIYLPWAISLYRTEDRLKVIQIANEARKAGRPDVFLEALASKAAAKAGDKPQADQIIMDAEQAALQAAGQHLTTGADSPLGPRHLAWFYCFAKPDKAQALDWANKAYAAEPNTLAAGSLLAYALVMNDQIQWAKPLVQQWGGNQIADVALARIFLAEQDQGKALESLRSAVAKDPGSLIADEARDLLAQQGQPYRPAVEPEAVLKPLATSFGQTLVPRFIQAAEWATFQVTVPTNTFPYGSDIQAKVVITNQGCDPLVIGETGWLKGVVRVDARITGDLTREVPGLVSRKVLSDCRIAPGHSAAASLPLAIGPLREFLLTHVQANLKIEFTVYWDPHVGADGRVAVGPADLAPATLTVSRPAVDLTAAGLRNMYNAIPSIDATQRIKTAALFVGLLKEEQAMAGEGVMYKVRFADWMPGLLKSALTHDSGLMLGRGRGVDQWVVEVHALTDMIHLSLDIDLKQAAAQALADVRWPVRVAALYLLAQGGDSSFGKVLDWTAKYDLDPLVRAMAMALAMEAAPVGRPAAPSMSTKP
jgi:hypothetical protein